MFPIHGAKSAVFILNEEGQQLSHAYVMYNTSCMLPASTQVNLSNQLIEMFNFKLDKSLSKWGNHSKIKYANTTKIAVEVEPDKMSKCLEGLKICSNVENDVGGLSLLTCGGFNVEMVAEGIRLGYTKGMLKMLLMRAFKTMSLIKGGGALRKDFVILQLYWWLFSSTKHCG